MHRNTRNRRLFTKAALLVLLSLALPAAASEPGELTDEQRARLEARFDELRKRLDLSEEQRARLEPVLEKDLEKRIEVMRRHGVTREAGERPGRREMRELRRDLDAVREETEAEIGRILDERQLQEYRNMRQEAQDEMRERMRSRRAPRLR